jgi:uncharacterized protein
MAMSIRERTSEGAVLKALGFMSNRVLGLFVTEAVAGAYSSLLLRNDPDAGQMPQAVVPAGNWFASHASDWKSWALVGCTVSPASISRILRLAGART